MKKNDLLKRTTHLPDKKTINLALVGKKGIDLRIAIPAIILIIAAAVLISKFAVIDRFAKVTAAEREVAAIQKQIDDGYEQIAGYGELAELYAHYTYSDMTEEELNRADRVVAYDMLIRLVLPKATINSWSIKDNTMTVSLSGNTLQEINLIAQQLMEESNVDYCTVTAAATDYQRFDKTEYVNAQITVYLLSTSEEVNG